jgi:hypothetical protein
MVAATRRGGLVRGPLWVTDGAAVLLDGAEDGASVDAPRFQELAGLTVDQRAPVQRVLEATYLVLQPEELLVGLRVDDVEEAVLVVARLLRYQAALLQRLVGL